MAQGFNIGDLAVCQHGVVGIINRIVITAKGTTYYGVRAGRKPGQNPQEWQSVDPKPYEEVNVDP